MADSPHQAAVIGLNQTKKALLADKVELLYVPDNADERLIRPILSLAQEKAVACETVATMKKLGKRLGIDVGAACGAVLKK